MGKITAIPISFVFLSVLSFQRTVQSKRVLQEEAILTYDVESHGKAGAQLEVGEIGFKASEGATLGRYQLIKHLYNVSYGRQVGLADTHQGLSSHRENAWPKSISGMDLRYSQDAAKLGGGSFGEVWKALDKVTGQEVVLKLIPQWFIDRSVVEIFTGKGKYKSWKSADKGDLHVADWECSIMQILHEYSEEDPVGVSRIAKCLENHANYSKNKGTSKISYIVQELGGPTLYSLAHDWKKRVLENASFVKEGERLKEVREIIAQLVQALDLMDSLETKIIHHDIKLENIVYTHKVGGLGSLKLIDFGAAMWCTKKDRKGGSMGTPLYQPPEVGMWNAFREPCHSYDVYSTGMVYVKLLCPGISLSKVAMKTTTTKYKKFDATVAKFLAEQKDSNGHFACPNIKADELKLVLSMLGSYLARPSPAEILDGPVLKPYVSDTVPTTAAPVTTNFRDLTNLFKPHLMQDGNRIKCCCDAKSSTCQLVDLSKPHPKCDNKYVYKTSCTCLVGSGWRTHWKTMPLGQCIVDAREADAMLQSH